MNLEEVVPRFSFFFQYDYDLESAVIGRVARRLWAVAMKERFGLDGKAAKLKFHSQTSGRSLTEQGILNNISRTAIQLFLALVNHTNSAHSNAYDEAITTPTAQAALIASQTQALLLEETGLFRHMQGLFAWSPGIDAVTDAVERGVCDIWEEMDRLGGVISAVETRYTRGRIQDSFYKRAGQIADHTRHIVGVNCYRNENEARPQVELSRTPRDRREMQARRVSDFKRQHAAEAAIALERLQAVASLPEGQGNVFEELLNAVEVCTLGQIVGALQGCWGKFRAMV
jgi:methylmalonyl-CoA mutase